MRYFDVRDKAWKPLASLVPATDGLELWSGCYCAETVGRKLFVAGWDSSDGECIYCYDTELKVWEKCRHPCGEIDNLCIVGNCMYVISFDYGTSPQRYSFSERQWQTFAKVNITRGSDECYHESGVTFFHSKVYVLYGRESWPKPNSFNCMHNAVLHCFDPVRNVWEKKASTCQPHFRSSLFAVNSKLYAVAGKDSTDDSGEPCGDPAPVEVYDEENNKWSIVEQNHIPGNNLGAVEIEGRVYFLVNRFPVDSGIRIPPGEVNPVCLDGWENLRKVEEGAVLCYAPLKDT